ncbi:MAG: tetratricopeptide repeat protein [Longimicrobiales bacterium]
MQSGQSRCQSPARDHGSRPYRRHVLWLSLLIALSTVGCDASGGNATLEQPDPQLGTVDFPISCSAEAQRLFNRGIALLHHMTYPQARTVFEQVSATDPACAMAHWGIAMTLFQPLWPTRPQLPERRRGWEEVQRARALQPPTEREGLFVSAAEAFFRDPEATDYWARIRRWERASGEVHDAFPDDAEAAVFFALAQLATAPSDTVSLEHAQRAAELLLAVYERSPGHPGMMHYLVHANDAPGREHERLEIIRQYETVAPRNPHALHMPTHIYTRLGDWGEVIRGNLQAADAALETPAGSNGEFVWDEYPHALEYLVYAYLQQGADNDAVTMMERLRTTARLEPTFKTAFHTASVQARYALERHAWSEAAVLVPREPADLDWDRFLWPEAIIWFARGLGAAHQAEVEAAGRAIERLEELETAAAGTGEVLFERNIRILRLGARAWLEHATGNETASVELLQEAADLEESTPKHAVTPAPTLPSFELLGDLHLEQKRMPEALAAYQRSLELYPRRFNSLIGAARAARSVGDEALARQFYGEVLDIGAGGTRQRELAEAQAFLSRS